MEINFQLTLKTSNSLFKKKYSLLQLKPTFWLMKFSLWKVGKKGVNYANRLENIVFIELLRRGYTVDVGKLDSKEIDFIARKADEILYVQVAFEISENTHETDNLLHIKDNYKKILVTGKYYEQIDIDGIEVIYVVDWLLQ